MKVSRLLLLAPLDLCLLLLHLSSDPRVEIKLKMRLNSMRSRIMEPIYQRESNFKQRKNIRSQSERDTQIWCWHMCFWVPRPPFSFISVTGSLKEEAPNYKLAWWHRLPKTSYLLWPSVQQSALSPPSSCHQAAMLFQILHTLIYEDEI